MLLIIDRFDLASLPILDTTIRITRYTEEDFKEFYKTLKSKFGIPKSLIRTKKASKYLTELLGEPIPVFASTMFTIEDFLMLNKSNHILYGVEDKESKTYIWHYIRVS